jgi:Replicase family/Primase C terminal 1 (PriCT-1)
MFFDTSIDVFSAKRLPRRPLCTDDLSDGCWYERQDRAVERRYIQVNPPGVALWLTFDIDRPAGGLAWQEAGLPQPAWSCTTRANGHGHLAYALEMPVCGNDLANNAVRFLEAVKEGYRLRLGGDPGYAGVLTKNPRHANWLVERGLQKLWSLGELAEYVSLPSTSMLTLRNQQLGGLGRNCDTFDRLRFWAYRAVKGYRSAGEQNWMQAVGERAEKLNELNMPGFDHRELKHIVRSVGRWVWNRYEGQGGAFNHLASQLGRMGGRPRTTTADGQPWALAGISRATWYRSNRQTIGK